MARPGGVLLPALFGLSISMGTALADTLDQEQATAALKRIAEAARQLSFKGTFVYQHGKQVETSRIYHLNDGGTELEKLEMLDGPRREFIRTNDEVLCFYPEAKRVTREKRVVRRVFPALIPDHIASITAQYTLRKGSTERIAGYDSQALELTPKDGMRYGHKFWMESRSGLLLMARMEDENENVVEQFRFTQLEIGPVERAQAKATFKPGPDWRVDPVQVVTDAPKIEAPEWIVRIVPSGFRKILETRRTKQGNTVTVTHMVYSDGLASVSVFIEPTADREVALGLSRQGAFNIYRRKVDDQVVTVLGETPAPAVQQIGDSVASSSK